MPLTDCEIREWADSASVTKKIAADLATMISTSKLRRFDGLPDGATLARKWNVSRRTVTRAKGLLADRGLIELARDGRYYVA